MLQAVVPNKNPISIERYASIINVEKEMEREELSVKITLAPSPELSVTILAQLFTIDMPSISFVAENEVVETINFNPVVKVNIFKIVSLNRTQYEINIFYQ